MNLTEYKKEVGSLTLSAEFKENLKQLCAEKSEIRIIESPEPEAKDVYSKIKVYKYVAMAACLLAVISTIGAASIISQNLSYKKSDNLSAGQDQSFNAAEDYLPMEPNPADNNTSGDDEKSDLYSYEPERTAYSSDITDDAVTAPTAPIPDTEEPEDSITSVESPQEDVIAISNAPGYDGEFNTTDFVLYSPQAAEKAKYSANIYDSYDKLEANVEKTYGNNMLLQNVLPGESNESDSDEIYDDDTDADSVMPDSAGFVFTDQEVKYATAYNFYDVLDNQLKDASDTLGATLVRMTINGVADSEGVRAPGGSGYTLYSANVDYDYLNLESCDNVIYVWIKGTDEDQVVGMPCYVKGDDIIASVYLRKDGCITVIDELLYDVYSLNGVDVAYHRYYSNVNPGNTDMGILDGEETHYTTTLNNPAEYVHKASVKELTRYIRRKISGEGYAFADLDKLSKISTGAESYMPEIPQPNQDAEPQQPDTPDEVVPEEPAPMIDRLKVIMNEDLITITANGEQIYLNNPESANLVGTLYRSSSIGFTSTSSTSTAMFIGGQLVFDSATPYENGIKQIEISNSGCPLNIEFCGISVGDALNDVKEALNINRNLSDNCKLTIAGGERTVVLTFEYGILTKMTIS